jgi:hypothetical protein
VLRAVCSHCHSLTNDRSSSGVPTSEGGGEEWVRGFGRLLALYAIIQCHMHAGTLVVSGICQAKNRVLQSIIFSTVTARVAVNAIACRVHVLH